MLADEDAAAIARRERGAPIERHAKWRNMRTERKIRHDRLGDQILMAAGVDTRIDVSTPVRIRPTVKTAIDKLRQIVRHQIIAQTIRSEEHTSELQSLMRISYAVFCLKKKKKPTTNKSI